MRHAHRRRSSRLSLLAFCSIGTLTGLTVACDGPGVLDPDTPMVDDLQMQVVAGAGQVGVPGEPLPDPLVVRVVNQLGNAKQNQIVNFVVVEGGGSVFAGSSLTNAEGTAQEIWTLGHDDGVQRVEARAVNPKTGEGQVFAVFEANAGEPALPLQLSPDTLKFTALSDTLRLTATGGAGTGGLQWSGYTWSSRDPTVATVDDEGLVQSRGSGQTWVVASYGAEADSARIEVAQLSAQLIIGAPAASLESARSMQLTASVVDASGNAVGSSDVVWTSSDPQLAEVSANGLVRAIAPGPVTITAASGDVSGTSTIDIFDAPLPGTLFFSDDMESGSLDGWHDGANAGKHTIVTNPTAARTGSRGLRVDYPSGEDGGWLTQFFTTGYDAVHVRYWVQLAPEWQGGTALVGVFGSRTDDRWSAFGKYGTCPNGTDYFNTFLDAAGGNPGSVGFRTSHPGMGSPCQGSDAGSTYMDGRALTPGQWHRIELEIKANTPGSSDGEQRMWIDGELKGTWNGIRFRDSYVLMLNAVQLSFGNAAGAPQNQHLFVDDFQVSYLDVPAGADPVASVTVLPAAISLEEGETAQLEADLRNAQGASLTGQVAWTSSNTGVATVDATGRVSALAPGSATVSATSGGFKGTASVAVTAAATTGSASVELSVTSLRLTSLGASSTLGVTAKDENGTALAASDLSWTSTATGVANVNGSGSVTALSNGQASIIAVYGSAADTATVTVSQEVASLTVTPSSASLEVGESLGLTAEARDAQGAVVQGTNMTWTSSNAGVATVNGSGGVAAVGAGSALVGVATSGHSANASITVTAVDNGGGGTSAGGWPNQPSGFVQITDQPWDALSSLGWSHMNRESSSRIVSDASAPHSPSNVLEHIYPAGYTNHGAEPAVDWINLGGQSEIFVGFWWKASNPWHGHSTGINKVLFAQDESNNRNVVLVMRGPAGGPYYMEAFPEGHPAASAGYLTQNRSQIPVTLGQWQRVELRVSIPQGSIKWWVDGTLVGEYSGLDLASGGFGELQIAPTWGGLGGSDKQQTDYFRYDHIFVSRPGG